MESWQWSKLVKECLLDETGRFRSSQRMKRSISLHIHLHVPSDMWAYVRWHVTASLRHIHDGWRDRGRENGESTRKSNVEVKIKFQQDNRFIWYKWFATAVQQKDWWYETEREWKVKEIVKVANRDKASKRQTDWPETSDTAFYNHYKTGSSSSSSNNQSWEPSFKTYELGLDRYKIYGSDTFDIQYLGA